MLLDHAPGASAHGADRKRWRVVNPQRRFNWPDAIREVTSANSATPYRDELFGSDFGASVFSSEPANNLVHREVLEADGVTFTSHRAADEQAREFVASTDNWFRPTMLKIGPDGALYIADIYRLVIEHPEYFPEELKSRPDLRAGDDKGRIWRVYPEGATLRTVPRLDELDTAGLVNALESPNGWQRDTAMRLLAHRAFQGIHAGAPVWRGIGEKPITSLRKLLIGSPHPETRLQALCALNAIMASPQPTDPLAGLKDAHSAVREQAIRFADALLLRSTTKSPSPPALNDLQIALTRMTDDPSVRVRYELALHFGLDSREDYGRGLGRMALRNDEDKNVRLAILNASGMHILQLLDTVGGRPDGSAFTVRLLAHMAGAAVLNYRLGTNQPLTAVIDLM